MKKIKLVVSVIVILTLLAVSTVGMFALPTSNIDNRKANVAVVNEDNGATLNGNQVVYGTDFTHLFTRNTDGKYEVTSRAAAIDGLSSGKYDLTIIVPSNFTRKALTFDSKEPEEAYLEYVKSPTSTQVESLKSEVVAKILKETANKALIETFAFEILKSIQDMQAKSLAIMENEVQYQKNFKDNVEKPFSDSMTNFNKLLGELSSQQGALSHFDSSVKSFESNVNNQSATEKKHLSDFTDLKKRYEETSKLLANWTGDYNTVLKAMNDDTYLAEFTDAQSKAMGDMQTSLDELKKNTVQLEMNIKDIEDYNTELKNIRDMYEHISNDQPTGVLDQKTTDKLTALNNRVNNLVGDNTAITNAVKNVTVDTAKQAKDTFEAEFANACSTLPVNVGVLPAEYADKVRFNAAVDFCQTKEGPGHGFPTDNIGIPNTNVIYTQTLTEDWSGSYTEVTVTSIPSDVEVFAERYDRITQQSTRIRLSQGRNQIPGNNHSLNTIRLIAIYKGSREVPTNQPIASTINLQGGVDSYLGGAGTAHSTMNFTNAIAINGEQIRPKQKEAIESIKQLESLSNVYYGKTVTALIGDYNSNPSKLSDLPSDMSENITGQTPGIKKFRPYATASGSSGAWNGSLIARVEKVFDYNTLKKEVTKALATELLTNTDEIVIQLENYINELRTQTTGALDTTQVTIPTIGKVVDKNGVAIVADAKYYLHRDNTSNNLVGYNAEIAKMEVQYQNLVHMSDTLKCFNDDFRSWVDKYNEIADSTVQMTKLHENEGHIVIQLEDNQKNLLTGVDELQKQITGQLDETKQIMTDADKLKKESDESKVKIEGYMEKLQDTKKKFDDTVKDNGEFVNNFVKKYTNSQNGGADNPAFYQNLSKPVELKGKDAYNSNSLVPFFITILITIFALIIAYFYNQWRIRKVATEHEEVSMFSGLAVQIGFVALTAIAAAGIIGFIGVQALDVKDVSLVKWFVILSGISISFTMAFYMLLLRFKTYGMLSIGLMMLLYFITNGALGLNIMRNASLSWLQWINPLIYFEKPLQGIIFQQDINLLPIFTLLFLVTIGSVVIIYLLQPLAHRQEMKESK